MSAEVVSVEMFKIWASSQKDILETLTKSLVVTNENIASMGRDIRQMNVLLKDDITAQKASFNQHVIEYNFFTKVANDEFVEIKINQGKMAQTLESRQGLYDSAMKIKLILTILGTGLLAGVLSAWGKEIIKWVTS